MCETWNLASAEYRHFAEVSPDATSKAKRVVPDGRKDWATSALARHIVYDFGLTSCRGVEQSGSSSGS